MKFGDTHKTDFLIPPFAMFYFYLAFAAAFGLPTVSTKEMFHSEIIEWLGVVLCFSVLSFLLWSLISFGKSFRVGIDTSRPDKLVTDGIFCLQPRADLCGVRLHPDRSVPDFLKLDTLDLCAGRFLAFSRSGSA